MNTEKKSFSQDHVSKMAAKQQEFCSARKLADDFLTLAKIKSEKMAHKLEEDAREQIRQCFEKAERDGYEKGRREGLEAASAEVEKLKIDLQNERELISQRINEEKDAFIKKYETLLNHLYESYKAEKEDLIESYESEIIEIIIIALEKLIKKQMREDQGIILQNLQEACSYIEDASKINVRLHPEQYKQLENLKKEDFINLLMPSDINFLEDKKIEQYGFVIESNLGVIDGEISTQINLLKTRLMDGILDEPQS